MCGGSTSSSGAHGRFDPATSDLDFIVDFAGAGERGYALRYLQFTEALEALFQRPVDLLTERMIGTTRFRAALERTHQLVYERDGAGATP